LWYRSTEHFEKRRKQRGLRKQMLSFILKYGIEVERAGAIFIFIELKKLPPALRKSEFARKASKWLIVQSPSGELITCYATSRPLEVIKKKTKLDLRKTGSLTI